MGDVVDGIVNGGRGHGPDRRGLVDETDGSRRWLLWVAIGIAALVVRLVYLSQIEGLVFFRHPVGDARGYDAWAQRIAGGDWWGSETFYQAPLYPYFLACVYKLVGHDLWVARVVQCVLGSAACSMVGVAGALFFSRRIGALAGMLAALYPPAMYFDGIGQKSTLAFFLMCALLCLLGWSGGRSRWYVWGAVGVTLGLLGLTRENALALVPVVVTWLLIRAEPDRSSPDAWGQTPGADAASVAAPGESASGRRRTVEHRRVGARCGMVAVVMSGIGLVLCPVGCRNAMVGGEFVLTTFQSGPNFYMGNHAGADGRYAPLIPGRETPEYERTDATSLAEKAVGHTLSPREVSRFWHHRAWEYIASDPIGWLKLMGIKWWLVWNRYEIPDTESYYVYRDASSLLGSLGGLLHFGMLCPLAVAGIVLTWSRRRRLWLLYVMAVAMAGSVAVFYVFGRYRHPLVPIVAMFAAAGLVTGMDRAVSRDWALLGRALLLAAAAAVWVNWPINPERELDAGQWGNVGATLAADGYVEDALPYFKRAVALMPGAPRLRYFLGVALAKTGRYREAVAQYEALLSLAPRWPDGEYNLAVALEAMGKKADALDHYRRAVHIDPADRQARRAIDRLGKR